MTQLESEADAATSVAQVDAMTPHERTARRTRVVDDIARLKGYPRLTTSQRTQLDALEEEYASILTADAENEIQRAQRRDDLVRRAGSQGNTEVSGVAMSPVAAVSGVVRHPLEVTAGFLDDVQESITTRTSGRFTGGDIRHRAALTSSTYGAPRTWASNVLAGPRLLHVAAGVPQQPGSALFAQLPSLTLPTATTSVGENVSLTEYASSTANSVTLGRFGRFTDLSRESLIGADAGAIVSMHRIGVAKDLDSALIGLVNTAAGTAVAFTTDVPAAIRKAQAQVVDNTAAADAASLVILVHPDNAALLESVAPISGSTIAEGFTRFSGSLVYPSSAVPTGFMLVANLQAGSRYFEASPLVTENDLAVKTGTLTVATSVIGGYGLSMPGGATGFAIKVDVVTP